MKRESFVGGKNKEKAHKELIDETPVVFLFFKTGCPACEAARPAWNTFSEEMEDDPHRIVEIEEEAIPEMMMSNIRAFPTYVKYANKVGKHHVGSLTDPEDIYKKLRIARTRR